MCPFVRRGVTAAIGGSGKRIVDALRAAQCSAPRSAFDASAPSRWMALQHPGFDANEARPVGERRDAPQILANMLLADEAHRHLAAATVADRHAEEGFEHYIDRLCERALLA